MKIEVSTGEIVDKLSILQIKLNRIDCPKKLANILEELSYLKPIVFGELGIDPEDFMELKDINLKLWKVEDRIRELEQAKDFGPEFIETAREVYHLNDIRAAIKYRINRDYSSKFIEEKSYE